MSETPRLALPLILAEQAQKHVTHNEALASLDGLVQLAVASRTTATPPVLPGEGEAYLCPAGSSGEFAGHDDEVALFTGGAWRFHAPGEGWRAWVADEAALVVYRAGAWEVLAGAGLGILGVNATADATNRLAVRSEAALFSAIEAGSGGTGDLRFKLNKEADGDTVSQLYQIGFQGRAETGLIGDGDFVVKVSPDGATWFEAIRIDKDTGAVSFPNTP